MTTLEPTVGARHAAAGADPWPTWRAQWAQAASDLPGFHVAWSKGDALSLPKALGALTSIPRGALDELDDDLSRLAAIDVLMVEAAARTQGVWSAFPALEGPVMGAAGTVARRLGIPPIVSYPLYIVHNPPRLAQLRRFTPLASEYRFVRMHQQIETGFHTAARLLRQVGLAADWQAALEGAFEGVHSELLIANRLMSGFRDPVRMPPREFADGFRPYFGNRAADEATGRPAMEGPSGLQSPAFRVLTMALGLKDAILDGWTEKIAAYHEPAVREELARYRQARDGGNSLAGRVERALSDSALSDSDVDAALPKLHAAYGRFLPPLVDMANARGYVQPDVAATLVGHGVRLGVWPLGSPDEPPPAYEDRGAWSLLAERDARLVGRLIDLEALWLGFCLEHMATTAYQIGNVQGTGGTSGVEFLSLATFRRLFPGLWLSGVGQRVIVAA